MATLSQHPSAAQAQGSQAIREIPIADSSFLQHVKYDPSTFQMTVTMKTGAQYIHFYVYPMTVEQLIQAPSKGRFYGEAIKGKFPGVRVINKGVGPKNHNPLRGPEEHGKQPARRQFARVNA